ncbi:hypothetical protein, partial [Pseudomonas aeruginosa]|uniref:hypothetical protein n=1 Tax=Pseudomonas aeruginosa TaxID=287 RepID=UPI00307DA40E
EKSSCADISPTVASMTQSKGFKKKIGAKRTRRLKSWVELQSKRRKTNPRVKVMWNFFIMMIFLENK